MTLNRAFNITILLLIGVLAWLTYTYFQIQQNSARFIQVAESTTREYQLAQQFRNSTDDLTNMARSYAATGDKKFLDQYNSIIAIRNGEQDRPAEYYNIYWDYLNAGEQPPEQELVPARPFMEYITDTNLGFTEEEIATLREAQEESDHLSEIEQEVFKLVQAGDNMSAVEQLFNPNYFEHKLHVMDAINRFLNMMEERTQIQESESRVGVQGARTQFLVLFFVALMLIAASATLNILEQRREVAERTRLHEEAEAENERLNNSVIGILGAVNDLSNRDLTARAPVTEDVVGTVSAAINAMTDETANVLVGVNSLAGQVSDAAAAAKTRASLVSQTAEEERANLNAMMETLFEATQTMNQVAALSEQSNISAAEASEVTEGALATVTDTVRDMESIRETIAETEKRIKRLGERSQEISGIVNLINTIAERTHVLALNASMQAAVAGEAGRGFAVVAEEVQRLAESARNATEQIGTLVGNIQLETNETINTVNRTIEQVVVGSEQAQRAGEQMRRTQEITGQLVEQVRSIAGASEQQKAMSAQLLEAVQRLGEGTEHTAEQVQAQNVETDSLIEAARLLVDSVSVFKLPQAA